MAFVHTDLGYHASPSKGPRIWSYATNDTAATVDSSGYFNLAANVLNVGDMIFCRMDMDGTPGFGVVTVLSNTGTVVDTGDLVNFAAADTD